MKGTIERTRDIRKLIGLFDILGNRMRDIPFMNHPDKEGEIKRLITQRNQIIDKVVTLTEK